MIDIIKNNLIQLRRNISAWYKVLLPFVLITFILSLINGFIILQFINFLFDLMVLNSNSDIIAIFSLGDIFSNPLNILLLILVILLVGIIILLEYIVIIHFLHTIYISNKNKEPIKFFSRSNIKSIFLEFLSKINIKSILLYFFYFIILLTLLGIHIDNSLVSSIHISQIITSFIYSNTLYTVLYFLFKVLLVFITAKLTPLIFVYSVDNITFNEARIKAKELYTKYRYKILKYIVILLIFSVINEIYKQLIANEIFYNIITDYNIVKFHEIILFIIFIPFAVVASFISILYLISFIHIFFDDDELVDIENTKFLKTTNTLFYKIITVVVFLFFAYSHVSLIPISSSNQEKIMVHRGGGNIVFENTMEALDYSISKGFNSVEIDTIELKDGTIILSHDPNLKRLTGDNIDLNTLTYTELQSYTMIGGYKFITLEEALDKVSTSEITINVELKYHGNESNDYVKNVVQLIKDYNLENNSYISSFDYNDLLEVEELQSSIKTLYFSFFYIGDVSNIRTDGIGVDITYLNKTLYNNIKNSTLELAIFTINSEYDMFKSLSFEPDFIITDEPENLSLLQEGLESFKKILPWNN